MTESRTLTTQQLYKAWRGGDPDAGQAMAQRFSDWYYAVTSSRLGDALGREPLVRSCTRFQQGIVGVANEGELVTWAHGILVEELATAGGRIPGGDFASPLTSGRSPKDLLTRARAALPSEQVRLLQHAYDSSFPLADLAREAEEHGGMPLAVLRARYALKRWLRDNENVGFTEVPDEPNLDYAPLPLYEAGRMSSAAEEAGFEKWLLSNMPLCKDIAEFGVFALALRAGALREAAAAPAPTKVAAAAPTLAPTMIPDAKMPEPAAKKASALPMAVLGAVAVIGVVVVLGLGLAWRYFLG